MSLHLILGPMFSGKSTRLIQHIRSFKTLGTNICIIKPNIDQRYTSSSELCTHDKLTESCISLPIDACDAIWELPEYKAASVVMIEEGQFFKHVYDMVYKMMEHEKRVYVTALNGDSERRLFGDIYRLLPLCHSIEWLTALCIQCKDGTPAVYSKRKVLLKDQIQVAGSDVYEAVCGKHYC